MLSVLFNQPVIEGFCKNALETNFDNVDISPEQLKFIIDHGSSILTESFYDWLVEENAKHLLPLI